MTHILEIGPINGAILLTLTLLALGAATHALRAIRRGEEASLIPVVLTLALPLAFSVYAGTLQLDAGLDYAMASDEVLRRQTLMAMAISRAVHTQVAAGIATGLPGALLIAGCALSTTLGERPRARLGIAAIALTFAMTALALAGGQASGMWELASVRALLYLAAGIGATAALLSTHERGPGAHVGPLAAAALPLLVAGLDATIGGAISIQTFEAVVAAAPEARQAQLVAGADAVGSLRGLSGLQLALALALAALGPVASLARRRDLVPTQIGAMGMSLVTGATVLIWSSGWFAPFLAGH